MLLNHMEEHFIQLSQKDSVAAQELRAQVEQMFAETLGPQEVEAQPIEQPQQPMM